MRRAKLSNNATPESALVRFAAELRKIGIYQPEDYTWSAFDPNPRFSGNSISVFEVRIAGFMSLPQTNIMSIELELYGVVPSTPGTDILFDLPTPPKLRANPLAGMLVPVLAYDSTISAVNPLAANLLLTPGSNMARIRLNTGAAFNATATFSAWANFNYRTEIPTPG